MIFAIKPFEIHDGDGIRTTVFFKGCPLRCKWCHNPESLTKTPQLSFDVEKCVHCGQCAKICTSHIFEDGHHRFDRSTCVACGKCVAACDVGALKLYGENLSVEEIIHAIKKDELFIKSSGGGVTLSGGEPLMQPEFCLSLLKAFKREDFNTAVDTTLYAPRNIVDEILPYTDTLLVDIKAIDPRIHKNCTGADNALILGNIRFADQAGKRMEIRYPFVPGFNDTEAEAIAEFVKTLRHAVGVRILPYHDYAKNKYRCLDMPYAGENIRIPTKEELNRAESFFTARGINVLLP